MFVPVKKYNFKTAYQNMKYCWNVPTQMKENGECKSAKHGKCSTQTNRLRDDTSGKSFVCSLVPGDPCKKCIDLSDKKKILVFIFISFLYKYIQIRIKHQDFHIKIRSDDHFWEDGITIKIQRYVNTFVLSAFLVLWGYLRIWKDRLQIDNEGLTFDTCVQDF